MTTSLLLEHFDGLIVTPDDVDLLNHTILQLAIQGKLLPQNNTDENASEILKRIHSAKNDLNIKDLPSPIRADEKPFELPKGWEWTRLNDICYQITDGTHYTPQYLYDGVPFLSVKNVSKGFINFNDTRFISQEEHELFATRCNPEFGDVILTKVGTTGIAVVVDTSRKFSIFVSLALLKFFQKEIAPDFLALVINSPFVKKQSEKYTMGVGNKNLVLKHIKSFSIPLPPLAEQKRIVARVEELFAQTTALAKQLTHSRSELDALNQSTLAGLLASETPEEFNKRWAFIAEHFDLLFQAPEHVAPLRQSILELAVRGKLTRREAGDESAQELLGRIRDEKEKLGKTEFLPTIAESEKQFELPNGWEWARLNEISQLITDGTHATPNYVLSGVPFISVNNLVGNKISFRTAKFITNEEHVFLTKRCKPEKGDILLGKVASIGVCDVVAVDYEFSIFVQIALLKIFKNEMNSYFLKYAIMSSTIQNQVNRMASGTTIRYIGINKINLILCPIPPIAEQERIVHRVEQLLSLCDALEARLRLAEQERGRLVSAVMAQVGVGERDDR